MRTRTRTDHRVTVPEGELDGARVARFEIPEQSLENLRMRLRGRGATPGWYTGLWIDGQLWMSDTNAEWYDHLKAVYRIGELDTKRVLINGLGIGMVVKAALDEPHVEHVDVVEHDERVAKLIGPHYATDPRFHLHVADAYTIDWPKGTRWDVAWHDIWPTISDDNLSLMSKLHRKYGRRVDWQGSWSQDQLRRLRRREQRYF